MKPIKIAAQNSQQIVECLKSVNGRAHDHAYTDSSEIEYLADKAEAELERLGLPKTFRAGAIYRETSGNRVSNSYARKCFFRAATSVTLERRSTGWFLANVQRVDVGQQGCGEGRLSLTTAQSAEALVRFIRQYDVIKAEAVAA